MDRLLLQKTKAKISERKISSARDWSIRYNKLNELVHKSDDENNWIYFSTYLLLLSYRFILSILFDTFLKLVFTSKMYTWTGQLDQQLTFFNFWAIFMKYIRWMPSNFLLLKNKLIEDVKIFGFTLKMNTSKISIFEEILRGIYHLRGKLDRLLSSFFRTLVLQIYLTNLPSEI